MNRMEAAGELVRMAKKLMALVTPSVLRQWEDLTEKYRENASLWNEKDIPVEVLYNEKFFIALLQYPDGRCELGNNYPIPRFGLSFGPTKITRSQYEAVKSDIVRGLVAIFGPDKVMNHVEKYNLPKRYSRVDWKRLVYGR